LRLAKTAARDEAKQRVATYYFEMVVGGAVVGGVRFRAENDFDVETFAGNIGYNVDEAYRGRHFAERACRLLLPLAAAHGFASLCITCDHQNRASQRTCERLGAVLLGVFELPKESDMYRAGERFTCRYRLVVPPRRVG
jgi:predicted acetyltransferase